MKNSIVSKDYLKVIYGLTEDQASEASATLKTVIEYSTDHPNTCNNLAFDDWCSQVSIHITIDRFPFRSVRQVYHLCQVWGEVQEIITTKAGAK